MSFQDKKVVVTGGARGIGHAIVQAFEKAGAQVAVIDIEEGPHFVGDVGKKEDLDRFMEATLARFGHLDYLINNAPPLMKGLEDASYEDFTQALAVGVTAPFYLAQAFAPVFRPGAVIINMASSRVLMSQAQTDSYAAAKGGITALTHSLAMSLAGRARVLAISPGWIETGEGDHSPADALQQPVGRVGRPEDIAHLVLFLCSDKAGFITGENIVVDGGMTKNMIYHGDAGWTFRPDVS